VINQRELLKGAAALVLGTTLLPQIETLQKGSSTMAKSIRAAWRTIAKLRKRGGVGVGGGLVNPDIAQIVIVSSGDADNYLRWENTSIVTYPDTFAFANLQHTAPDGLNGVFNLGVRQDTNNQSCFSTWLNGAGLIVQHAGAWRYVLDMSYDYININTPVNILPLTDGVIAPAAIPGSALIYVDVADGDLKVVFADGVVKTLATDS
jgi:hypothetical protein